MKPKSIYQKVDNPQELFKYFKFIEDCKLQTPIGYSEAHHILPRCLKGTNKSNNLVRLSYTDHILVHLYLARAVKISKLYMALKLMTQCDKPFKLSEKEIKEINIKIRNIAHSEETKQKMSKIHKGKNNSMYGKKHTQEAKQKLSKKHIGKNNYMYGKKHTEESKQKMSKAKKGKKLSKSHILKMSEVRKGKKRKKHTQEAKIKMSKTKKKKGVAKGQNNSMAKLNQKQVNIIKYLFKNSNLTNTEIAEIFEVTKSCISHIRIGRTWV